MIMVGEGTHYNKFLQPPSRKGPAWLLAIFSSSIFSNGIRAGEELSKEKAGFHRHSFCSNVFFWIMTVMNDI